MNMAEFAVLRDVVYQKTGLLFENKKMYYVERRVRERMELHQLEDIKSYIRMLKYDRSTDEFQALVNSLTVNETYFFREYEQLRLFAEDVLPRIVAGKKISSEHWVRVWSAGCSTGDEAYTLAIVLNEMLEGEGLSFEVVATDINTNALAFARRGVYKSRAIQNVPELYLEKYFFKQGESFLVKECLKEAVTFQPGNLVETLHYESGGFDSVFCRNVLIYFDDQSRTRAIENLYNSLLPGGYVFLGHSESMGRFSELFRTKKIGATVVYRR
ncbi:hypothetical protein SY88_09730 [Clostridiales bacterium PH28_bin88]|nr:hypothetical protein SY88_09730 [Clostridiales bacterium PH28_bin88]